MMALFAFEVVVSVLMGDVTKSTWSGGWFPIAKVELLISLPNALSTSLALLICRGA